jgi:futalosine hydrolase
MLILVPTVFEAAFLFSRGVASRLEEAALVEHQVAGRPVLVALCGFGLAAAGTGAAHAIGEVLRQTGMLPSAVILAGIGGTYRPGVVPIGGALIATRTRCCGIGVGSGESYLAAETLGWPQGLPRRGLPPVGDTVSLSVPALPGDAPVGELLSVTAASASPEEAARRTQYSQAVVEEMEGFAVALAGRLYGVPVSVVRGVSNLAGHREQSDWRVAEALEAAGVLLEQLVEGHGVTQ